MSRVCNPIISFKIVFVSPCGHLSIARKSLISRSPQFGTLFIILFFLFRQNQLLLILKPQPPIFYLLTVSP